MFEHFTFTAQAQEPLRDECTSPTDASFPSPPIPPPRSSPFYWDSNLKENEINDIVHRLGRQSLSHENEASQKSLWQNTLLPSPLLDIDPDPDPFNDSRDLETTYFSTSRGVTTAFSGTSILQTPLPPLPANRTVACKRSQRQLNVQMQSCSNHVRDINTLVQDMVSSSSQCTLHKPASKPYLSSPPPSRSGIDQLEIDPQCKHRALSPDEDEGIYDMEDSLDVWKELSLRRASTPNGIRKINRVKNRSSTESLSNTIIVNGRTKVRSVPRMRKRKVATVPE